MVPWTLDCCPCVPWTFSRDPECPILPESGAPQNTVCSVCADDVSNGSNPVVFTMRCRRSAFAFKADTVVLPVCPRSKNDCHERIVRFLHQNQGMEQLTHEKLDNHFDEMVCRLEQLRINPRRCNHCGNHAGGWESKFLQLHVCSGCMSVYYCSETCQALDRRQHKRDCRETKHDRETLRTCPQPIQANYRRVLICECLPEFLQVAALRAWKVNDDEYAGNVGLCSWHKCKKPIYIQKLRGRYRVKLELKCDFIRDMEPRFCTTTCQRRFLEKATEWGDVDLATADAGDAFGPAASP